ncbi:pentapeptide repeat protein [Calothrix sp. NIES-4071]|nr:pentapeptide repeat protein [Calothrix sp. NIES-4071]BAZ59948.1 pentapeptide repeat protein [Calothrix sp. NIES-4105]
MPNNQNQPRDFDPVLGGNFPPPIDSVVLGGVEGIKRRLSNPVTQTRVAALREALKYGEEGLDIVIQSLRDESNIVRRLAYKILKNRAEPKIQQALQAYKPWVLEERLPRRENNEMFANRKIVDFNPVTGIADPVNKAYALRCEYSSSDHEKNMTTQIAELLDDPNAAQLEALVIGMWNEPYDDSSSSIVDALVEAKNRLTNLKAIFIGDMTSEDCEISWIMQSDISPILRAYPKLEVLQVRGGSCLAFNPPVRHDNLRALIVETGGLSRVTVDEICSMNLPALEHLEIWFGSSNYGGDAWIENVKPIVEDLIFPNLNYLGLRNSEFTDEIVHAIVHSPLLDSISILDLSMGTLGDDAGQFLLERPRINNLDMLNLSENFLSEKVVEKFSKLDVEVIAEAQKEEEEDYYINGRYCSVAE